MKSSAFLFKPAQEAFKPISPSSTVEIKAFFFINVCIGKGEGFSSPHLLRKEYERCLV